MEYRQLNFEIRQTDEDKGTFSGLANAFGVIDSYGSTFDKGSFTKTISEQDNVPTVWFHDPTSPIGSAPNLKETDEGLYVDEAELNLDVPKAEEVFSGMQFDPPYITEMSIGFETLQDETDDDGIEHKKEVKLYEISPLTKNFAANPEAQISEVRDSIVGLRRINQAAKENTQEELAAAIEDLRELLPKIDKQTQVPKEQRPYEGEHACRLRDPGDFKEDSFRRVNDDRESDDKPIDVIYGKLEGEDNMTEQAYRYPDDEWGADAAENHCEDHDGIEFEPSTGEEESIDRLKEARELLEDGIARLDSGSRDTTSTGGSPQGEGAAGVDPQLVEELKQGVESLR